VDLLTLKNVTKFLSIIGMAMSVFFIIPIGWGVYFKEDIRYFAIFDGLFFLVNLIMYLLMFRHNMRMRVKDSILSVNLIWILLGVAGSVPLYLYSDISLMDSFFEAISGFTTTGATIYSDIESLPLSILML